jgi:hypothetical protein
MRFRKLRIAWSVACAIACVLLIVLWVRSYWWDDGITCLRNCPIGGAHSAAGHIIFDRIESVSSAEAEWYVHTTQITSAPTESENIPSVWWMETGHHRELIVPHWFFAAVFGMFAAVPALLPSKWRFSLRTLLIATTLVAVVLGLIVYAVR